MEIFGIKKENAWRVIYPDQLELDDTFFKQAKEWGYNALVVESGSTLANQYGFKVILKVNFDEIIYPFDEGYKERIQNFIQNLDSCDAVLWHSPYFSLDCREHLLEHSKLKIELLLEELQTLESLTPLFYSIPYGVPTKHFTQLETATGPNTFLVFSGESPYLRVRLEKSIPIIEGLCEEVPLVLSETGRLLNDLKPGAFIKIDRSIDVGSYAECHLEAASKAISGQSFEESAWSWLKRHRPEIGEERHLFRALAGFAEKTQFFKAIQTGATIPIEELKMHCDSLAAEMKLFYYHLNQKSLQEGKFFSEINNYLSALKELSQAVMRKN